MPEIGKLISVFTAETAGFEAGLKRIDAGEKQVEAQAKKTGKALDDSLKTPSQSLASFSQGLNTVFGSRLGPLTQGVGNLSSSFTTLEESTTAVSGSMMSIAGPAAAAVAVFAAELTAVKALSEGLFDLAKSTAETEGHLFDLSQQTGVSVETLSALGELAKTTGGNLDSVAQSLVIFQGNMDNASDANSKAGKSFKDLNITITDTEQTLRDTLNAIAAMPEGFEQTNAAAELFGRRGGKQMLAILKESHGDINAVIKELQGMGLANSESARRADEFNDQLVKLETQLLGLKVTIGNQIVPTITEGFKFIERVIKENRDGFEALGVAAKGLTFAIGAPLLGAIQALGWAWKVHQPIIQLIAETYERIAAAMQLVTGRVPNVSPDAIPAQPLGNGPVSGIDLLNQAREAFLARQAAENAALKPFSVSDIFKDKKEKKGPADPGVALLRQLEGELRKVTFETRAQEVASQLLDKQYAKTNESIKQQIIMIAKMVDVKNDQKEADEALKQAGEELRQTTKAEIEDLTTFIQRQAETVRQMKFGDKTPLQEAEDFINAFANISGAMNENQKFWLRFNATLITVQNTVRSLKDDLANIAEGTPGIAFKTLPNFNGNVLTDAQQAALGVPPPDFSEIRRQMKELGFELTDIFAESVGDGFRRGIDSGLEDLSLGLIRIVEDVFLRRMAEGLGNLLSSIATGGGFFGGLLKAIGFGAAGGAVGGIGSGSSGGIGSAFAGAIGRDSGGPLWPNQLFKVHKDEYIVPSAPGFVIPKGGMGGKVENHYHNTIQLPPMPRGNYVSPKSQRQLAETLIAALQAAQS